jgi:AbrB family looped-hinge helix DNA binding protein
MEMALIEMRTATITSKGQIAIPKEMRKSKEFKEGSKVVILVFNDRIELRPMRKVSEGMLTAIASEKVLAKDWLSKEDEEAWKNL